MPGRPMARRPSTGSQSRIAMIEFNSLLVPVDFSAASQRAVEQAVQLAADEQAVIFLLHVLDESLAEMADKHRFGSPAEVMDTMRRRAERELEALRQSLGSRVVVETVIGQGRPFLAISEAARQYRVDAIVMGRVASGGKVEHLLFGSTCEKVMRASSLPVIVVPITE